MATLIEGIHYYTIQEVIDRSWKTGIYATKIPAFPKRKQQRR